jgi:hypothetical protein
LIKFGLIVALFFLPLPFLQAQNDEGRFIQRLVWAGDEYARRYEVVIEKEEEGVFREMLREFTPELFMEVPLLPGKYRCRVITHDFLNQPGDTPEWVYIEIRAATPEPVHITEDSELVYKTDDADLVQRSESPKKVDIFLSAAWMPSFVISDKGNSFFGRNMSLPGVAARFGVATASGTDFASYFKFNPGLELAAAYNAEGHLWGIGLNLLAMKWLPGDRVPMALTFRLGAGYSAHFQASMGVSFLLLVMDQQKFRLYLETGLDYAHWFTGTEPHPSSFRPWIGIKVLPGGSR